MPLFLNLVGTTSLRKTAGHLLDLYLHTTVRDHEMSGHGSWINILDCNFRHPSDAIAARRRQVDLSRRYFDSAFSLN